MAIAVQSAINAAAANPFRYPALKGLGNLGDHAPDSGDYSAAGCEDVFAVERKSVADLVGCCMGANREGLERVLHRLRGYRFKRLLIVGDPQELYLQQYSRLNPKSVLASLSAFEVRYDFTRYLEVLTSKGC